MIGEINTRIKIKKIVSQPWMGLFCLALLTCCILYSPQSHAATVPGETNYGLVWSDEFDGSTLNTSNWSYLTGPWGSSSVQNCYKSNNVSVSGGTLNITAQYAPATPCGGSTADFTSGFIQTKGKQSWTYGYFEARMKLPTNGSSTWPAFWMSPNQTIYGSWPRSGEIDVIEAKGYDNTYAAADAHWGVSNAEKTHAQGKTTVADTGAWHNYGVKWTEGKLQYYIDGVLFHTIDRFGSPNATTSPGPFNIPFYIRLNMAVGGSYLEGSYADANNTKDKLPTSMQVDYVRVYQEQKSSTEYVAIPDANLRKAINKSLATLQGSTRTDTQEITKAELATLTVLDASLPDGSSSSQQIRNLSGIESAIGLKTLLLRNNAITDISPLKNLTSLASLDITSQHSSLTLTKTSFVSPIRGLDETTIPLVDSRYLLNDIASGQATLTNPTYDAKQHTLLGTWSKVITLNNISTSFSGDIVISYILSSQPQSTPSISTPALADTGSNTLPLIVISIGSIFSGLISIFRHRM